MTEDKLEKLFELLCDDFIRLLNDKSLNSADRKTLIEFLKEQGVSVNGAKNKSIKNILHSLPFDENVESGRVVNL